MYKTFAEERGNGRLGMLKQQKVKVTYFDLRGRGELIRMILAVAEVPFEDNRVSQEDWPAMKPNTPNGSLPVLNIDGNELCQSLTIARFLANQTGLAGHDNIDKALADGIVDFTDEVQVKIMMLAFMNKVDEMKEYLAGDFQDFLTKVDVILSKNKSGQGFLVGKSITWADLKLFAALESIVICTTNTDFMEAFPKLVQHYDKIANFPTLKQYISTRKATPV